MNWSDSEGVCFLYGTEMEIKCNALVWCMRKSDSYSADLSPLNMEKLFSLTIGAYDECFFLFSIFLLQCDRQRRNEAF